jgi:PAS domain S-box-containing protein
MYAMLSGKSSQSSGMIFYRRMSAISALIELLCLIIYTNVIQSEVEYIWDRLLIAAAGFAIYVYGLKPRKLSVYSRIVDALYYIVSIHTLILTVLNGFSIYYALGAIIIFQSFSVCFRRWQEAWLYISVWTIFMFVALIYRSPYKDSNLSFALLAVSLVAVISSVFAYWKGRYISSLKLRQKALRALVNKTEHAVILTDTGGSVLDMNETTFEMFGYNREDILGKDFAIFREKLLTDGEVISGFEELRRGKFWNSEVEMIRKDKSTFHASVSISMISWTEGKLLVYRVRDISRVKQEERELIAAREAAEEAVKAKSHFLATMSHEIRTPLNGVIGTASLLERTSLNTEQSDYIQTIINSSNSLLVLLNDILDFSKIESGKMQLDPIVCDLRNEILSVTELLRPHAETKNLRFVVSIDKEIPERVKIDVMRLKQILLNLLGNAIKFTDKGSVHLTCQINSRLNDALDLKFEVKDTGLGISKEKQSLLFQSFSQVHTSSGKKYGGTGLGLAISKDLVELMGGKIQVESSEGLGSSFKFNIRVNYGGGIDQRDAMSGDSPLTAVMQRQIPFLRVAVAEDNRINSDVIVFMLAKMGIQADRAFNGLEMIELIREKEYDIVLMDVHMPELDGIRAAKIILKELKKNPYIIAITANSSIEDRNSCEEAGMRAFVSKPFMYTHIEKALADYFKVNQPEKT